MTEYAPGAIRDLFDAIEDAWKDGGAVELSGIVGDQAHTYGYHRARNCLPASDYSVTSALDRRGDGWAASALDVKFNAAGMRTATRRLLAAAKHGDSRVAAVREFYGTLDGERVTGWDLLDHHTATSDDSHLWHVHLSIFRAYANDRARLMPIVDVIVGRTVTPPKPKPEPDDPNPNWSDMATEAQIRALIRDELNAAIVRLTTLPEDGDDPKPHRIATVVRRELERAGLGGA